MPVNKNALIRYQTIDRCLSNRQRRWTLVDLIAACVATLSEYEGKTELSRRTLQLDIQAMRSGKLGYKAPIVVVDKRYYEYADPAFSINKSPVDARDLQQLWEAIKLLRQFPDFPHLQQLEDMAARLEDSIQIGPRDDRAVVDLEQNPDLEGLQWLPPLHQYILNQEVLKVSYQRFGRKPMSHEVHPYLLKEYRNRWYLIAYHQYRREITTLALDRIRQLTPARGALFIPNTFFKPEEYYRDTIGVTVFPEAKPYTITIYASAHQTPYLQTKPLHHSQVLVRELPDGGSIFQLYLRLNYELYRSLLALGPELMVVSPKGLRLKMEKLFQESLEQYQDHRFRAQLWQQLNKEEEE